MEPLTIRRLKTEDAPQVIPPPLRGFEAAGEKAVKIGPVDRF